MRTIYLDNNASTSADPRVVDAMAEYLRAHCGNPAGQHQFGRAARRVLEDARDGVARLLNAQLAGPRPDRVIFTSGATEANNLAVLGLAGRQRGRVLLSAVEHPSVVGPAEELKRRGFDVQTIPVSSDGVAQLEALSSLLTADTRLVCIMYGNHETGVVQPVRQAAELCRQRGVPLHVDAVQAVGKIAVDFTALGCSSLSLSAHKFHGPIGVGALVLAAQAHVEPLEFGGFQQFGLRPGSESASNALGLHTALQLWQDEAADRRQRMSRLRDRFEHHLLSAEPRLVVCGAGAERLPHVSNIAFPGFDRQALTIALDAAGVACSAGSACASGSSEPSAVLLAMGLPTALVEGALRFSLSAQTSAAEVDQAVDRILLLINKLRERKERRKSPVPSRRSSPKAV